MRKPDFEQLAKVLKKEAPDRPVLFEFYMNGNIYEKYGGGDMRSAFFNLGYDYATAPVCDDSVDFFKGHTQERLRSISQNEAIVSGRGDFEKFEWRELNPSFYREQYGALAKKVPPGGKLMATLPNSMLGGLVKLFGYEGLCALLFDDPELVREASAKIGERLLAHTEMCCSFDCVGVMMLNDDWGFKTQTRLSPSQMRELIIPWYVKMARAAHERGKFAVLHSCGNMWALIDDVCDICKFDGKHSYEDNILPPEKAWSLYGDRIAVLGGIDVDFLCRKTPGEIKARARALLEMSARRGGYALGSGNSIADYVPEENYLAMLSAAQN
jgi:uroporphyrinogen decarboxylase